MVVGVGLHPFGRFPDKDLGQLAIEAVLPAWKTLRLNGRISPRIFRPRLLPGHVRGETSLPKIWGLTGVPIVNVENACSSGSTAFWQAYWGITTGLYDMALAFGAEKVPRGPVTVTAEDAPERYIGGDHMMAGTRYEGNGTWRKPALRLQLWPRLRGRLAKMHHEPVRPQERYLHYRRGAELADDRRPPYAVPVLPNQRRQRSCGAMRP
ncbi:MAG: hypothetical protein CM1200mP22_05300 [Dehalococcoidia bacterium]|nr:MAG: hypothetical protein CM1200mP22_05300 [Dehalococcoidia bacterium]